MEQKSYVLEQICEDLKIKFLKLLDCDAKELGQVHRSFIESVNDYCVYKTIFSRYSKDESEENKKA